MITAHDQGSNQAASARTRNDYRQCFGRAGRMSRRLLTSCRRPGGRRCRWLADQLARPGRGLAAIRTVVLRAAEREWCPRVRTSPSTRRPPVGAVAILVVGRLTTSTDWGTCAGLTEVTIAFEPI